MNKLFEFLLFFYFFLMLSNINHLHHSFSYKKKKLETSITIPSLPLLNSTRNINQLNKNNVSIGFNNISGIDYDNTRIFFDSMVIPRNQNGLIILKKKLNQLNYEIQDMKIAILKLKNETNENRNFFYELQKIKNILSCPFLSDDNSLNISFNNISYIKKKSNNESIKYDDKSEDKNDEKNNAENNGNNIEKKKNNIEKEDINKQIKIENEINESNNDKNKMSKIQEEEENSKSNEKSIDKEKNIKYEEEENNNSNKSFKYPNQENISFLNSMKLIKSYNEITSYPDITINKIKNKNSVFNIKRKINKCIDKIKHNNEEINELKQKSKSINYIEQNNEFFKLIDQINWLSLRNTEINNIIYPQKQQYNESSNNEFQYVKAINKATKDESELLKQKCSILKLENHKHNKNNLYLDEKINSIKFSLNSLYQIQNKKSKELKNLREQVEQIDILKEKVNVGAYTIENNESEINKLKEENNEKEKKIAKLGSEKKDLLAKIEKHYKINLKSQNEEKEKYNIIKESINNIDKNIIKEKKEYKKISNEKKLLEKLNNNKKKKSVFISDELLYYTKKQKKKE